MGSSQLLYITLGLIIVGLAIFSGMNMFQQFTEDSAREELINHCLTILSEAEAYYKKPIEAGGGGGSYVGFEIPADMTKNELGKFKITLAKKQDRININAQGVVDGYDGKKPVRIIARITKDKKNPSGQIQILVKN